MRYKLSGDEAREVLWASSEEGKAQLRAAWQVAMTLRLRVEMADVQALLWAAHEAARPVPAAPDPGQPPAGISVLVTQLAGCRYCRCMLQRGRSGAPWMRISRLGEVLYPDEAIHCPSPDSPDGEHHSRAENEAAP